MILVALTGGIGSGKSAVSMALADRGAAIIDADRIVRQLQQSGMPVFEAMVDRWGSGIIAADGELDRQAIAEIVFNNKDELNDLETLVHPAVGEAMRTQIEALSGTDRVVVLDIPLLAEGDQDRRGASAVIVVDCPVETAIDRLVELRHFDRDDAKARVGSQVDRSVRLDMADFVVDNGGSLQQLEREVDRCWEWVLHQDSTHWSPAE